MGTRRSGRIGLLAFVSFAFWLSGCESVPKDTPREDPVPPVAAQPEIPDPPKEEVKPDPKPVVSKPRPARPSLSIKRQASRAGATATREEDGKWKIVKGERLLELQEGSRRAYLDGTQLFLSQPLQKRNGFYRLSRTDEQLVLATAFDGPSISLSKKHIVIDPGHGGIEKGAINEERGLEEKALTLSVSTRLQQKLEALGYRVTMTRYQDRLVPLEERSKIANRSDAGLFVSIHFNAAVTPEAMGIETYFLTPAGEASTGHDSPSEDDEKYPGNLYNELNFALGFSIQEALGKKMQLTDRGLKTARFKVLKDLNCPGVLVEGGFLSNPQEALLISTPAYQEKLATALSEVLSEFVENYHDES